MIQSEKLRLQKDEEFGIWFPRTLCYAISVVFKLLLSEKTLLFEAIGGTQTSNLSWDEPDLVSYVHEKFDVWLSYVRLNEFGSSNTFYPSEADG